VEGPRSPPSPHAAHARARTCVGRHHNLQRAERQVQAVNVVLAEHSEAHLAGGGGAAAGGSARRGVWVGRLGQMLARLCAPKHTHARTRHTPLGFV
jgi:hypothetical protein